MFFNQEKYMPRSQRNQPETNPFLWIHQLHLENQPETNPFSMDSSTSSRERRLEFEAII